MGAKITTLVDVNDIENIVGYRRHPEFHIARAISEEEHIYVLHSKDCHKANDDPTTCPFSVAVDAGIDTDLWQYYYDAPVRVYVDPQDGKLWPVRIMK